MPKIGKLSIISKEPHLEIKWEIKNFFSLPKLLFFSPSFSYDDETWYCRMDPSGDIWDHRSGWIYLALVRKSIGPPIRVKFTIALKTVNGEKVLESHYTEWFKKAGFGHPYLTFTSRSKLLERVSELLPSGILTVVYTLKILERSEDTSKSYV